MKKILLILLLLIGLTGCNKASQYSAPIDIKYDEFMQKIENKESFAVLIWQTGCSHCEAFEPILNEVIKKYDIKMYSINIANIEELEYAKIKNKTFISGTPTMVYFDNGVVQPKKIIGDKEESKVIEFFKEYKVIE